MGGLNHAGSREVFPINTTLILGVTEQYELNFLEILRDWLVHRFLADVDHLYEFGSGDAFNVAAYAMEMGLTVVSQIRQAHR